MKPRLFEALMQKDGEFKEHIENLRHKANVQITDTVSLAEIVEVGAGGVKKTKLFLILGDLAVQLTSD